MTEYTDIEYKKKKPEFDCLHKHVNREVALGVHSIR